MPRSVHDNNERYNNERSAFIRAPVNELLNARLAAHESIVAAFDSCDRRNERMPDKRHGVDVWTLGCTSSSLINKWCLIATEIER